MPRTKETPPLQTMLRRIVRRYADDYKDDDLNKVIGRRVRKSGCFSKEDFLKVGMWKTSRPKWHYKSNAPDRIRDVSRAALSTPYEKRRVEKLCSLNGVSVPVASALLTFYEPKKYGVIDIRVWQALFALGGMAHKEKGAGFSTDDWLHYLYKMRAWAKKLNVPVRRLELSLFCFHDECLQGRKALYDPNRRVSGKRLPDWLIQ